MNKEYYSEDVAQPLRGLGHWAKDLPKRLVLVMKLLLARNYTVIIVNGGYSIKSYYVGEDISRPLLALEALQETSARLVEFFKGSVPMESAQASIAGIEGNESLVDLVERMYDGRIGAVDEA